MSLMLILDPPRHPYGPRALFVPFCALEPLLRWVTGIPIPAHSPMFVAVGGAPLNCLNKRLAVALNALALGGPLSNAAE
jgi:hypothetical protein